MLETIFWIVLGAFVGWNLPQPDWAKSLQQRVTNLIVVVT